MNFNIQLIFITLLLFVARNVVLCQNEDEPEPDRVGTVTSPPPEIVLPSDFNVPPADFQFLLYAVGTQNYECIVSSVADEPGRWVFVEPHASLFNTADSLRPVGVHYFQPSPGVNGGRATWESTLPSDTSLVVTKTISQIDSPDGPSNIPWLVTQATFNRSGGRFSGITHVLRVATSNGVAPPDESCGTEFTNGTIHQSDYTAQYWYFVQE